MPVFPSARGGTAPLKLKTLGRPEVNSASAEALLIELVDDASAEFATFVSLERQEMIVSAGTLPHSSDLASFVVEQVESAEGILNQLETPSEYPRLICEGFPIGEVYAIRMVPYVLAIVYGPRSALGLVDLAVRKHRQAIRELLAA